MHFAAGRKRGGQRGGIFGLLKPIAKVAKVINPYTAPLKIGKAISDAAGNKKASKFFKGANDVVDTVQSPVFKLLGAGRGGHRRRRKRRY